MFGRFSPISSLSLSLSYACAWRRLSPSTDGQTGEAKDLWLFYFTDQPDLSTKLTAGLEGKVPPGRLLPHQNTLLHTTHIHPITQLFVCLSLLQRRSVVTGKRR